MIFFYYELLNYYKIRAFYDPFDIVGIDGKLLHENREDYGKLSVVIEGIEHIPTQYGTHIKIKLTNREKAMDKLTHYIGMIENKLELKIPSIEIGLPPMPAKIKKGKR